VPRVNRNLLFVIIAVVLGLAASYLAVQYVNKEVAARTPVDHTKTVSVVVPTHPLAKGDILKSSDVAARDVPEAFIPADAVTPANYEDYLGQQLRAPVAQGAPLSGSAVDLVTDHFSNVINPADVAITIQVDESNSTSGLMVPGDHVDIMLLMTEDKDVRLIPLQSNVAVLATGHRARGVQSSGDDSSNSYNNVTLELSPRDAQRLAVAGKAGELRLMLRKAGQNQPFDLRMLSKAELLNLGKPVRKGPPGVEFIIGNKS
jgi:pilus assembly protein CpaB